MTSERKKALLYLSMTFLVGILIGGAVIGFLGHIRDRGGRHERKGLTHVIGRVVRPNESQTAKIDPIIKQTEARLDTLQKNCNQEVKTVMDSLRIQLKPILTAEQLEELEEFISRGKDRWKGR